MIIVVYSTQYKPMNDDVDDDHDNYTLKLVLVRLTAHYFKVGVKGN